MMVPLLMEKTAFDTTVVSTWGTTTTIHSSPHPVGMGGPTFEYYTKLSHLSLGLDADVMYAVGFDLGMNVAGYLKYSF